MPEENKKAESPVIEPPKEMKTLRDYYQMREYLFHMTEQKTNKFCINI